MPALPVTAAEKTAADAAAVEWKTAVQSGAGVSGADTVDADATLAALGDPALAAMQNVVKAGILISIRNLVRATAALFGVVKLSSAPAGDATALNYDEVSATPGANKVPRADAFGSLNAWVSGGGGGGPSYSNEETPAGSGTAFTTAHNPAGNFQLFRNGVLQRLVTDYTRSGTSITLGRALTGTEWLRVFYLY